MSATAEPRLLLGEHEQFKEEVRRSRGKILLLVHPLYDIPGEKYRRVLRKLKAQKHCPVVVLEEEHRINTTHNILHEIRPFYVATQKDYPMPVHGWNLFHLALREGNVKQVLLGGMQAHLIGKANSPRAVANETSNNRIRAIQTFEGRPDSDVIAGGCVGTTYTSLILYGHKRVKLVPELLSPDKPLHYKRNVVPKESQLAEWYERNVK